MVELSETTKTERDRYMALALDQGRARRRNFGRNFSEADFFAGAMLAFEAFSLGVLPPEWVFGIMSGRSLLTGERSKPRTVRCGYRHCGKRGEVYEEQDDAPDGWHLVVLGRAFGGRSDPQAFCTLGHLAAHAAELARSE